MQEKGQGRPCGATGKSYAAPRQTRRATGTREQQQQPSPTKQKPSRAEPSQAKPSKAKQSQLRPLGPVGAAEGSPGEAFPQTPQNQGGGHPARILTRARPSHAAVRSAVKPRPCFKMPRGKRRCSWQTVWIRHRVLVIDFTGNRRTYQRV